MIMPVKLQWHSSLPILQATYTGNLSATDYTTMCDERQVLLSDGPKQVILLSDLREMKAFKDADIIEQRENILLHPKVICALIVVEETLYRNVLRRSIGETRYPNYYVHFFADVETALGHAKQVLNGQN
jgi:hypothetical protein